ncbi:MAG: ATP-binding protein [Coriobacteriia bacterium]|nr:ATP-binding protein [Coriobacteriia bacterium]
MEYSRKLVSQLAWRLQEPRQFIQIVVGPRQTGKTTAVSQALSDISTPIHFVSADDPGLLSQSWLKNEWERARVLSESSELGAILVVDEIQKIPQWSSVVKLMWDEDTRFKTPVRVVLTGSSSLLLKKGMSESLAGRFEVLYSPHWNLEECREAFGYTLEDFLYFGGYPGAASIRKSVERWRRYMSTSIVEPTISQDVLQMEEIRKPALMRALFYLGAAYSAQELSYVKLQGQLQDVGNTVTLAHYLELLGRAGMLCGLEKFTFEKVSQRKSSPRFMVFDTSLLVHAADVSCAQALEDTGFRGHLVESAVGAYLLARSQEEGFKVFYWRERNHEVDFVLQKGASITAIEVKSGRVRGLDGSQAFLKRYPQALCYVVGGKTCPLEEFLLGKVTLFKAADRATDTTPVTPAEIIGAFREYLGERAD